MNYLAKSGLAVALGLAMATTAQAGEALTVYGKLNVSVQNSDEGDNTTEVNSNASRVGVKGGMKLSDDVSAFYKVEWEVNVADDDVDNFKSRNQYVGLKGGFGEVAVGRNDTLMKQSQGKIDLFSDLEADIKQMFNGEDRLGNTVTYKSPKFNGFQLGVAVVTEDNAKQEDKNDGDNGTSLSVTYGDAKLKKSSVYAAVAHNTDVAGYDITRVSVQGKLEKLKLGGMFQTSEKSAGGDDEDGWMVSASYPLGAVVLKAQYQDTDMTFGKRKDSGSVATLGADYKFNSKAKVYGFYSDFSLDNSEDNNYLGLGMEYKF